MLDPFVGTFSQKPVFQIQHGRRVLILHQPAFIRDVRQRLPSAAFQKPAVYLIDIFCHIHAVKFLPEIFGLFFRQFSSFQSLVFIYHIFHYSIHARKQRHILKTKIKQMDQFLFGFMKPVPCQIPEIHQAVLQCGKKSFHLSGQPFRLFIQISFISFRIRELHQTLQLVIPVFAVRSHIFKFPVDKEVKTHLLHGFFAKFRQDMRNIICKHTARGQDQNIRRFQIPAVVIQKIRDPVEGDRSLATSGCALDHKDLILCIADNGILLLLDGAYDILQLYVTVASQFLF